eukprot:1186525-Prorocentrum_minimum.AAC.3
MGRRVRDVCREARPLRVLNGKTQTSNKAVDNFNRSVQNSRCSIAVLSADDPDRSIEVVYLINGPRFTISVVLKEARVPVGLDSRDTTVWRAVTQAAAATTGSASRRDSNSPVAERLNKGLMAVWSPTDGTHVCSAARTHLPQA